MSTTSPVILLEFNELTPWLMTRFMREGHLPNFSRLFRESRVFTTDAEESGWNLEPWIQWVTVHSGVPAAVHGVRELGEAHRLQQPALTDILSAAERRVWICGSMNARYDDRLNGAFLPDPWTTSVQPRPHRLRAYYRFVQRYVHEHTRAEGRLTAGEYLGFLGFMLTHGLSPSTATTIARQLLRERGGRYRWQRVAAMDRLQWDVFRWYYARIRPHFSTFFLNSTAHLQHKYWRNLDPDRFTLRPTAEDQAELEGAILFGYRQMDGLIGRFLRLAGDHATLVFCTALSQQPCLLYEDSGGKAFYRPRDIDRLLAFVGVTSPYRYFPVMSEQFRLEFDGEAPAVSAHARLAALRVSGQPVMYVRREGAEVFGGCSVFSQLSAGAMLEAPASPAPGSASTAFAEMFYQADGVKSGMHHPDGMLWIRLPDRRHAVLPDKVSLLSIAPTILRLLDVTPPDSMRAAALELDGHLDHASAGAAAAPRDPGRRA